MTTGEVDIHKHVVNDTETVEVPVKREEIVIERKPVTDQSSQEQTKNWKMTRLLSQSKKSK